MRVRVPTRGLEYVFSFPKFQSSPWIECSGSFLVGLPALSASSLAQVQVEVRPRRNLEETLVLGRVTLPNDIYCNRNLDAI